MGRSTSSAGPGEPGDARARPERITSAYGFGRVRGVENQRSGESEECRIKGVENQRIAYGLERIRGVRRFRVSAHVAGRLPAPLGPLRPVPLEAFCEGRVPLLHLLPRPIWDLVIYLGLSHRPPPFTSLFPRRPRKMTHPANTQSSRVGPAREGGAELRVGG